MPKQLQRDRHPHRGRRRRRRRRPAGCSSSSSPRAGDPRATTRPRSSRPAVADKVIPAGTHMYADHPTDTEDIERPGPVDQGPDGRHRRGRPRSSDRRRPGRRGPGRPAVARPRRDRPRRDRRLHPRVGHRHRRGRGRGPHGRDHRGPGRPVMSVDFVTRAGRGGKVLSVLESAAAQPPRDRPRRRRGHRQRHPRGAADRAPRRVRPARTTWRLGPRLRRLHGLVRGRGTAATTPASTARPTPRPTTAPSPSPATAPRCASSPTTSRSPGRTAPPPPRSPRRTPCPRSRSRAELTRLREEAGRVTALESERDTAVAERATRRRAAERDQLRAREPPPTHAAYPRHRGQRRACRPRRSTASSPRRPARCR